MYSLLSHGEQVTYIGYGMGMPYGQIGVRFDYESTPYTAATIGLGFVPSVGIQLYFRDRNALWRPRIGLHYGWVETWDMEKNGKLDRRSFWGESLEVGQMFRFHAKSKWQFDFGWTTPIGSRHDVDSWIERKREQGYQSRVSAVGNSMLHYNFGIRRLF